jgi:hypothetical protein
MHPLFAIFPGEDGTKTIPRVTHCFVTDIYPLLMEPVFDNAVTKLIPHVFIADKQRKSK